MKIAITRTDGGVSIMTVLQPAQLNEAVRKWKDVHPGEYASHRPIQSNQIPADRSQRNAWKDDGAGISVDPVKAAALAAK